MFTQNECKYLQIALESRLKLGLEGGFHEMNLLIGILKKLESGDKDDPKTEDKKPAAKNKRSTKRKTEEPADSVVTGGRTVGEESNKEQDRESFDPFALG